MHILLLALRSKSIPQTSSQLEPKHDHFPPSCPNHNFLVRPVLPPSQSMVLKPKARSRVAKELHHKLKPKKTIKKARAPANQVALNQVRQPNTLGCLLAVPPI
jgi:hypothetical protein